MKKYQTGITEDNTSSAMYMLFNLANQEQIKSALELLQNHVDGKSVVVGFGNDLMKYFAKVTEYQQNKFNSDLMSRDDGCDLAIWIKDEDKGKIFHKATMFKNLLGNAFALQQSVSAYTFRQKFDLSGFEDGIENPAVDEIPQVVFADDGEYKGSSFWVLQQWLHDFEWLNTSAQRTKEECIGRSLDDSEELDDLPKSAHIKKSAKENFTPEADLLRKSMPWSDDNLNGGLMFSCFSVSFRSFNLQMNSMLGIDDGIPDGVFKFSKIMNTNYLWCPAIVDGKLDLSLFTK